MLAGASCWVLYVDVLVLEMGGELITLRSAVREKNICFDAGKRPPSSSQCGWGLRTGGKYRKVSFLKKLTVLLSSISVAARGFTGLRLSEFAQISEFFQF